MGTLRREVRTRATPDAVWEAIRDVGALHTRLVPGFVTATALEGDGGVGSVRTVTFANGAVIEEPIVALDPEARRLVWTVRGGNTTHYNSSVQALPEGDGTRVVWTSDFLPDEAGAVIGGMMDAGAAAMQAALDALA